MSLTLEVNGLSYGQWTDIKVNRSLDNFPAQFSFTAAFNIAENKSFPIKEGDKCTVFADGKQIINGFVEVIEGEYSMGSHSINIRGRSRTCDLVDSTVAADINITMPASLKSVINQILQKSGFTDIAVNIISEAQPKDFTTADKVVASVGDSVISVIDKYCRKRQLYITDDFNGDLVLFSGSTGKFKAQLQTAGNDLDNIKSARVRRDSSKRFNKYTVHSQQNLTTVDPFSDVSPNDTVGGLDSSAMDIDVRAQRRLNIIAESPSNSDECKQRANWQANINRARAFSYSATVEGHETGYGETYDTNYLVGVLDIVHDVRTDLLINSIDYSFDLQNGSVTDIGMVPRDAYTSEPSQPADQKSEVFTL